MDRKPIMAANWKMHFVTSEAESFVKDFLAGLDGQEALDIVIAPPYTLLPSLGSLLADTPVDLAAQNLHWETHGAYTGEVSAGMLKDMGCKYVIVGHSERRQYFGENNQNVNRKIQAALSEGLLPILCVGEVLDERKNERTLAVVQKQVKEALQGVDKEGAEKLVIAYEPVWAIGTGETATPEQAQEVHLAIRNILSEIYDEPLAAATRIQYGGSVKPANVCALMGQPDIDGALVGGASLKADSFTRLVKFEK